jgi:manganese/zinc/iron transport system substrate-binding protein
MRCLAGAIVALALLAGTGCGGGQAAPAQGPVKVVATTTIVADLVGRIGGEDVALEALMGPGVDPHLYKPSAGDVWRLSSARAIFYNGLHLEGKMGEVFAEMSRRGVTTVAVADCIPESELIRSEGFSGVHDPHCWFDVSVWCYAAECVRDALVDIDPDRAAAYRSRADAYLAELTTLDGWVRERAAALPEERRVLVTAHDAFGYFGRAYGFDVRGLMGVSTAAEAATSDVQQLARFIAERRIPAVFVESSVPPRFIRALREAVAARGFEVAIGGSLYSDALGDPAGPAATYPGMVRSNVETITSALAEKGEAEP